MFYELIYTRCRQGMDILKKGQPISSDGYKVYACTPAIMDDGVIDLPFFANAVQTKQSYNDPSFMDDTYLYYAPDKGASFLLNFYPVPFDANAKGDYSRRPGNFVNHALVGDFSGFYPFEMFKDKDIWNAKTRGEAYYYENAPSALPSRDDVGDPPGQYTYEDIAEFIADGRKEALATAVSFLIAQYDVEPENRKFLVIRDDSSEKIELWIAAIEYAFSPRMAAAIPFATRMDKFKDANRYTVNQLGVYQTQMNLQDPNQRQRYRAMIVGVDERDKSNVNAARPLANSPFVLLEGKEKRATFAADTSAPYYQLVTRFDEEHQMFCREFLQTFDVTPQSAAIFSLYEIFKLLNNKFVPNARTLAEALEKLGKYQASNTPMFIELYKNVNEDMSRYLQEDLSSALSIINWLYTNSRVIGDSGAKERLSNVVCGVFFDHVFFHASDSEGTRKFWMRIKKSEFARDVAHAMTDAETIRSNITSSSIPNPAEAITFVTIYLESAALVNKFDLNISKQVVQSGLEACYRNRDKASVREIVTALSHNKAVDIQDFLFALAKTGKASFAEFIIGYMIDTDDSVIASDNAMRSFCDRLYQEGLEPLSSVVMQRRLKGLNKSSELERFIKTLQDMRTIGDREQAEIFEMIDREIDIQGKNTSSLAELVQTAKPRGAICRNSAHVYAIERLSEKRRRADLLDIFEHLRNQGFPSSQDKGYIGVLSERLLKVQLSKEEQGYMLDMLIHAPDSYLYTYVYDLCSVAVKQQEKWNVLIAFAAKTGNRQVYDTIVQVLVDSRQSEKSLDALASLLIGKPTQYFNKAADAAWKIIRSQKSQSGIGMLLGLFMRGNDKSGEGKKK